MRFTNALFAMAVIAFAVATVASADPTVNMVWTGCEGGGCGAGVGTSDIVAGPGDTLTLDMLVAPDSTGVSFAALSYDISAAGVVSAYTRTTIDSINDGLFQVWDYSGNYGHMLAPASATYTGIGLTYVPGSGVVCPGPPAVGNLATGICGQLATGTLSAIPNYTPSDLGGGIIGSFPAGPGLTTEPQFTLAQAQFVVEGQPCEAVIDINVLKGGSPTVISDGTKDITSKARILKGTAPPDATITNTTLTIRAYDDQGIVVSEAISPELLTLVVGKGGEGDTLSLNIPTCDPGEIFEFVSEFRGTGPAGGVCEATSGRLSKTCE
jgi:hypothetical protein